MLKEHNYLRRSDKYDNLNLSIRNTIIYLTVASAMASKGVKVLGCTGFPISWTRVRSLLNQ
jgi:hypothetical protein